jgi:lupus La protein
VAFKLKKTMVGSVVQQDNIDEGNDSATKLEVSSSMEKLSGQGPESTLESDGIKQGKSSDDMTKEKELNTAEAAESEKFIGDAPVESDKHGDSESLSRDGKNISGNVNVKNQISREDLKEAFKKFGTVRVINSCLFLDFAFVGLTVILSFFCL